MLPILDLGIFQLQTYPFFWGLSWGISFYYIYNEIQSFESILHLGLIFIISWFSSRYAFDLSGGNFHFSSGLGFVFYGGLLGALIYIFILYKLKVLWIKQALPLIIVILPLAHGIGRIGCFLTGCCHGVTKIPIQLIEATALFLIFLCLKNNKLNTMQNLGNYFLFYGCTRLILEFFRSDSRGYWGVFTPSVWVSMALIGLGFFFYTRVSRNC